MREWKQFAVGEPSAFDNRINVDCCPFETVSHVCHIHDAFRIFEDDEVRPSLVADESKLRSTRTSVTWLSPNTWVNGSRYGNISFNYNWSELIRGKNFYWVEAITHYRPAAFRILITDDSPAMVLKQYAPRKFEGPLAYDKARAIWYRNGKYTGEFMFDGALPLSACVSVTFERHHDRYCNQKPACSRLGEEGYKSGAMLLARLIGQHVISPQKPHLTQLFLENKRKSKHLLPDAIRAWGHIIKSLRVSKDEAGTVTHKHPAALYLASAILDRWGSERTKGARTLSNLFRSSDELRHTLSERAARAFGMNSHRGLLPEEVE